MKALILGASGLLGQALRREWSGDEVIGLSVEDVDIRDAAKVREAIEKIRPEWIVLAAAYTDVDGCESNQELAFAVNRDGAVHVAQAAERIGARVLFLSSDYVFDGTKTSAYETDDPRNPQSVYGRSKAEAEVKLLEELPGCCIVRTAWMFGTGGKCFPDTILKLAATRSTLDVVNDQRGCPTYSIDLARVIPQLCRKGASGIVHATNAGSCSWFEFAREIVRQDGLRTEIRPITTQQMPRPAKRPAYSVLSPASLNSLGIKMPSWQDAVSRYLEERKG
ncbi:MAG TPA: dTDP-4-dehydrorhamnose reductase [Candidatus Sulfotelmatobacter sp.]|nr:dTDP-4-dehydrorhamnose reductase [Candidatus Sulfotelmatobacter sp.]